jgi:thioredoxin-like negative regulator of GroEL
MLGTQAEFEKRVGDAQRLYKEAWDSAADDYEKCIAAHYVAHLETEPHAALEWNLAALNYARQVQSELVKKFFPSLYVNLGHSYKVMGDAEQSDYYFKLAADLGLIHQSN